MVDTDSMQEHRVLGTLLVQTKLFPTSSVASYDNGAQIDASAMQLQACHTTDSRYYTQR